MKIHWIIKLSFSIFLILVLPACSFASTPHPTKTPTRVPSQTYTLTPVPTSTSTATVTPIPTATQDLTATQQYDNILTLVNNLAKSGYLTSTKGDFRILEDYSKEWAQLGWYEWVDTDQPVTDFVLQADLSWESANQHPNPSGCGIIFHLQPDDSHYLVYVATDGFVYFQSLVAGKGNFIGKKNYGVAGYKGTANLILIVTGAQFRVLIDGKSIGVFRGYSSSMLDGDLGYTIVSGTNTDYGTRCDMTNVNLWKIIH